jgi:hypothetical protein
MSAVRALLTPAGLGGCGMLSGRGECCRKALRRESGVVRLPLGSLETQCQERRIDCDIQGPWSIMDQVDSPPPSEPSSIHVKTRRQRFRRIN